MLVVGEAKKIKKFSKHHAAECWISDGLAEVCGPVPPS